MTVQAQNLTKVYGKQIGLDHISFTLTNGVVALLGSNGAGKSTLLRLLATLIRPDAGQVSFGQWSYAIDVRDIRRHIGYLPQELDLPAHYTPRRLLQYLAALRLQGRTVSIDAVLEALGLSLIADCPFGRLSTGQIRLVGIAQAFLGNPRLLLLDELARGLDVQERERVFRLIRGQGNDRLVLFSTHIPAEIEYIAQQAIVLHRGHMLYSGPLEQLCHLADGHVFEIQARREAIIPLLDRAIVSRILYAQGTARVRIIGQPPAGFEATCVNPTLEDSYLYLMQVQEHGFERVSNPR